MVKSLSRPVETQALYPLRMVTLQKDVSLHCKKQLPQSKKFSVYSCTLSASIHRNFSWTRTDADQFLIRMSCLINITIDTSEFHASASIFNTLFHMSYYKVGEHIFLVLHTTNEGTERLCDFLRVTLCSTTGTVLLFPST